ncbi:hypothetical protein HBE96_09640 [Clostridium sp. P21]|uniref:Uncharacterized protein n=1 Tax=Clostridium muellerianum TaxID=2716538 RepID=A0A7Y0EGD2_9CLOT|nr:hypothetical protein [Clostridium muellerianum]NMM62960.1 hypothetical protein [Clostridium muellerianum]
MEAKIFMSVSQLTKYFFVVFILGIIIGAIVGGLMVSKVKSRFKSNNHKFRKNK